MSRNNSIIIALEGIGGVGKTTQLQMLKKTLPIKFPHLSISFFNEFSEDNVLGSFIKSEIAKTKLKINDNPNIISHLLVIADRMLQIQKIHKQGLIIFDRFIMSDIAHAIAEANMLSREVVDITEMALNTIFKKTLEAQLPNCTLYNLYFESNINTVYDRIERRIQDKLEIADKDFLVKLEKSYDMIFSDNAPKLYRINANNSVEGTHEAILNAINKIIKN